MSRRLLLRLGGIFLLCGASLLFVSVSLATSAQTIPQVLPSTVNQGAAASAVLSYSIYLPSIVRSGGPFPNCRLGIGQGGQSGYDVSPLYMGWYLDWQAVITPTRPNQAEYVQVIRLHPAFGGYTFSPPTSTLYAIMTANPGATWLIGNEPDSPFQDNLVPEEYARAYHDLYALIKNYDPTAKVGAGGIVQPTPIRLQYLDRVWAAYLDMYGQPLSADLWNIHSYILREITPDDPQACQAGGCTEPPYSVWGAYIPPGFSATRGILYKYSGQDNLAIFQQRIVDFRTWMRDHGQHDKPLLIAEYGILFPEDYFDEKGAPFSPARAAAFMRATFDFFLNTRDASIGDPLDGDRLVQRWAWYSLNDTNFGGALFDPLTHARRLLGDAYATYASQITPSIDLSVAHAYGDPVVLNPVAQSVTAALHATFSNQGNFSVNQPVTVTFWDGLPGAGSMIGGPQVVTRALAGCGDAGTVSVNWAMLGAGLHPYYVEVDAAHTILESVEGNNIALGQVLIATHRIYLPLIKRSP